MLVAHWLSTKITCRAKLSAHFGDPNKWRMEIYPSLRTKCPLADVKLSRNSEMFQSDVSADMSRLWETPFQRRITSNRRGHQMASVSTKWKDFKSTRIVWYANTFINWPLLFFFEASASTFTYKSIAMHWYKKKWYISEFNALYVFSILIMISIYCHCGYYNY